MSVQFVQFSYGERGVIWSYLGVCLIGALVALSVGLTLNGSSSLTTFPSPYDLWLAFSGALGAGSALYLGRGFLGRSDLWGMICVLVGLPFISFGGALIAGTLALPIYGTMFGPLALISTFIENPFLAAIWATAIFGAHAGQALYQGEQDSDYLNDAVVDFAR
jgi:hypothetical protein